MISGGGDICRGRCLRRWSRACALILVVGLRRGGPGACAGAVVWVSCRRRCVGRGHHAGTRASAFVELWGYHVKTGKYFARSGADSVVDCAVEIVDRMSKFGQGTRTMSTPASFSLDFLSRFKGCRGGLNKLVAPASRAARRRIEQLPG